MQSKSQIKNYVTPNHQIDKKDEIFSFNVLRQTISRLQRDFIKTLDQDNLMSKYFGIQALPQPEKGVTNCAVMILISSKKGNIPVKESAHHHYPKLNQKQSHNLRKISKMSPKYVHFEDINFMNKPETEYQILYLKRTPHPKDRYSGHVCFPGGHCDPEETLFDTAIREAREEIGVDISRSKEFRFLGNMNTICCFKTRKGNIGRVTPFVFLHLGPSEDLRLSLQMKEVCDYFWFPFSQLVLQINNLQSDPRKEFYYFSKPRPWVHVYQYSLVIKKDWMILKGMTMGFSRKLLYKALKNEQYPTHDKSQSFLNKDEHMRLQKIIKQMNGSSYWLFGSSKLRFNPGSFGYRESNETKHDLFVFLSFMNKAKKVGIFLLILIATVLCVYFVN